MAETTHTVPTTMAAMLLVGHGGIEKLEYHQGVATPQPKAGEVLVQVTATAKNNTDRKAREGCTLPRTKAMLPPLPWVVRQP